MRLLIDNGHGIDTPGKRSPDGQLLEYAYTRRVAAAIVAAVPQATLLVPEQRDIPLRERVARVNTLCSLSGDTDVAVVSIHVNAAGNGSRWHDASGWMALTAINASVESQRLARILQITAINAGLAGNRALPPERFWRQSLAICRDTRCPAVLTENMFQDCRHDLDFLLSDAGFRTIVDIHIDALNQFIPK